MTEKEICAKIFALVMPHLLRLDAPVAYVNIEVPSDWPFSRETLKAEFEKLRWDTELSAADLFVERKENINLPHSRSARVLSITGFEDERGIALVAAIEDGEIV